MPMSRWFAREAAILQQVTEANVEALRRGYEALNSGDLSVVLELLDPEMEWHEPQPSPDAGTHSGRDSFERFFRGWMDSFEDFRVEPERVVERGGKLIAVVRQSGRGRSSGVEVDARLAHVWTVEDGRAVRFEAVPDPDAALADGE
jgi:ketosteroid isomerase-like protein